MRKMICITVLAFTLGNAHAQEIDSIVFVPAAPTSADTVRAYVYLTFPSGSCADVGTFTINGTDIYGYAFHCMGMISMICNDVDTLVIPPLAAGNYTMYFTLDAGYGPPGNCTPGFQPYDVDTVALSVSIPTGITESAPIDLRVYPNPASDQLTVESNIAQGAVFQLVNVLGETVLEHQLRSGSNSVPLSNLAEGAYQCRIISPNGMADAQNIYIMR